MIILGQSNWNETLQALFQDRSVAVAAGELSAAEIKALISYVDRGGSVLIAAKTTLQNTMELSFLRCAQIFPKEGEAQLPSPVRLKTEAGMLFEHPFSVCFSTMKPTKILAEAKYGAESVPLVWTHRWGQGTVVVTTLQHPQNLALFKDQIREVLPDSTAEWKTVSKREKTGKALLIAGGPTGFHPVDQKMKDTLCRVFPAIASIRYSFENLTCSELQQYDAVYLYSAPRMRMDDEDPSVCPKAACALIEYLICGGAIANLHFMGMGSVPETAQIFGGSFRMHPPFNRYTMDFTASDLAPEEKSFELEDEMHQLILERLGQRESLLICRNDNGRPSGAGPLAYQDIYGKNSHMGAVLAWRAPFLDGKIAYSCPGHRAEGFDQPVYQAFLKKLQYWLEDRA